MTFGDKTVEYRSVDELQAAIAGGQARPLSSRPAWIPGCWPGAPRQIRVTTGKGVLNMQWFDRMRRRVGMSLLGGTRSMTVSVAAVAHWRGRSAIQAQSQHWRSPRTNCAPRAAIWYGRNAWQRQASKPLSRTPSAPAQTAEHAGRSAPARTDPQPVVDWCERPIPPD